MIVASIQMAAIEGAKADTIAKAEYSLRQCQGVNLVILPEIWNIGFMSFDQYINQAETVDGPTLTMLKSSAKRMGAFIHSGSLVIENKNKYFNASFLISPQGEIEAVYRKIHLFGHKSQEASILTPGSEVVVADTELGKIGMATCYDLRFPELFRAMVDQGAKLFLVCSAWPYPRLEHWMMLNRVRAIENQCFLISSNSVGVNHGSRFVGHSMILDPWGTILASGGDEETIVKAEVDLKALNDIRTRFSALADRVSWLNSKCLR